MPGWASMLAAPPSAAWLSERRHATSGAKKGLGRHPAGRLVGAGGAEQGSGHAQRASCSDSTGLFEWSMQSLRNEFPVATSL